MIKKLTLILTCINIVNATLFTVENTNINYWTKDKMNSAVPFSFHVGTGVRGIPFFQLPVGYENTHCPANWTDDSANKQCILGSIDANSGYRGWFNWYTYLYFVIDPSKTCPAFTADDGLSGDGRHCSTNVYLGFENLRTPSYNNGVFAITYPQLTRTTLNQNNRPDWNTGKLYFTAGNVDSFCNAVVVSPTIIMTSAHCVESGNTLFTNLSFESSRGTSTITKIIYNSNFERLSSLNRVQYDYAFLKLNNQVTPGNFGISIGYNTNNIVSNNNGYKFDLSDMVMYLSYTDNNIYTSLIGSSLTIPGVYTFEYNKGNATGGEGVIARYNSSSNVLPGTNNVISVISFSDPEDSTDTKSYAYAPILDATALTLLNQLSN